MFVRKFFRSETTRLMLLGFVVGAIGLAVAQPGSAHSDAPAPQTVQATAAR